MNKAYRVSYGKFDDHFTSLDAAWKGARDAGPFWPNTVFKIYESEYEGDPRHINPKDLTWNLKFEVTYAPKKSTSYKEPPKQSPKPPPRPKPKTQLDLAFEVMQLDISVSYVTLKSQFRKLAKQTHPDTGGSEEQFRKVNEAYQFICNTKGW